MKRWVNALRQWCMKHWVRVLLIVSVLVLLGSVAGYVFDVPGLGASGNPKLQSYQPAKTVWDWLQLLIIPAALAGAAFLFNAQQGKIQRQLSLKQSEIEREIAQDQQREAALQSYLDRMSDLLLEKDLGESQEEAKIRQVARARTLTILRRLDSERKTALVKFLVEAQLVGGKGNIISLKEADLSGANLFLVDLRKAKLSQANLSGTNLTEANLDGAYLDYAILTGATLHATGLRGAWLMEANLSGTNLTRADLHRADLHGANLTGADLSGANLMKADLSGANLNDADLSGTDLREVTLNYAILHRADLMKANLFGAKLDSAELIGADLRGAILLTADLHGALLHGTDLRGAMLREANLTGALQLHLLSASKQPLLKTRVLWCRSHSSQIATAFTALISGES